VVASASGRSVIVGAGVAGRELATALRRKRKMAAVMGFLDDRFDGTRGVFAGLPLLGRIDDLGNVVRALQIDQVYIAIPSAHGQLVRRIVAACQGARVAFRIVPRILEIIEGRARLDDVRQIRPEDLLGRAPVKSDRGLARLLAHGRRILVTGGAGSIGTELCRQLGRCEPEELVALDWSENGIFNLEREIRRRYPRLSFRSLLGNAQESDQIKRIFKETKPEVVFHAAAYKHVPLMERFPEQALLNNIIGTWNVASAAREFGAQTFVLVSTDKAVLPRSIMGATKAVAELLVQSLGQSARFSTVRCGNVFSSSGSVIPIFQEQIRRGGPVTLTHPDMVRFFMTIPEAVHLIIQAARLTEGGEVFVLDMGEPVKILDIAENLIRLSGFRPHVDVEITFTGSRSGEKLSEQLARHDEDVVPSAFPHVFVTKTVRAPAMPPETLVRTARELAMRARPREIRRFLAELVPDFKFAKRSPARAQRALTVQFAVRR